MFLLVTSEKLAIVKKLFFNDEVFEAHIEGIVLLVTSFCDCVLGAVLHRHHSLVSLPTKTQKIHLVH